MSSRRNRSIDEPGSCQHPELPKLSSLGLSAIELLTLRILRTICLGCEQDQLSYWDNAFDFAERQIGEIDGPPLVARCISLLRAIRANRPGAFCYMSVGCEHISEDEQALLAVIRAETNNDPDSVSAMERFSNLKAPARLFTATNAIGAFWLRYERKRGDGRQPHWMRPTLLN